VECAKRIADINPKTVILFATAHEEYMPEAFSVYAFDYLVKPFKLERLNRTLERIRDAGFAAREAGEKADVPDEKADASGGKADISGGKADASAQKADAPGPKTPDFPGMLHRSRTPDKLMIRNRDGITLVDMEEILLIQREDRSTVICTAQDRLVTSESLSELEEKLDRSLFFRCHKSYIINLGAVSKIYPYGRWTYIVKLKGIEKDALMTHEKYEELEKLFA
jgi:two-component system LytT family response regulator